MIFMHFIYDKSLSAHGAQLRAWGFVKTKKRLSSVPAPPCGVPVPTSPVQRAQRGGPMKSDTEPEIGLENDIHSP